MKLYDQGVFIVDGKTIISEDEAVRSIIRVVMTRT